MTVNIQPFGRRKTSLIAGTFLEAREPKQLSKDVVGQSN